MLLDYQSLGDSKPKRVVPIKAASTRYYFQKAFHQSVDHPQVLVVVNDLLDAMSFWLNGSNGLFMTERWRVHIHLNLFK